MKNKGFTLIEMAIVICIIVILALMMFRMVGAVGKANDVAETRARLEKVGNALEEFRAIYGKYPPVPVYPGYGQTFGYECPDYAGWGGTKSSGGVDQETANNRAKVVDEHNPPWGSCNVYTFGLCSFFLPRFNGTAENGPNIFVSHNKATGSIFGQWGNYNYSSGKVGDSAHDLAAVRRILPYLDGKLGPDGRPESFGIMTRYGKTCSLGNAGFSDKVIVTNSYWTVQDAWYHELQYESRPPYDTFKIWSVGPDGKSGTDDDIIAGE